LGQEKTEKATPKKRRDARMKEGNVLQSKEVNTAASLLAVFLAMSIVAPFMYTQLKNAVRFFFENIGSWHNVSTEVITEIGLHIVTFCTLIIGPILLVAVVFGTIPTVIQTKGLFTMQPLKPKFSKLNPITGMKRLFSLQSLVNIVKGLIIIAVICLIVFNRINSLLPDIRRLPQMEPQQGVAFIASNIFSVVILIVMLFAFISAGDYVFQWWQFEKKLKMSKQEVKDEYKQIEGDPKIKSRIRQKQREIAQNRMMQEVPDSDVVVRNPTHYAVALRYEPGYPAPRVVAKGQDVLAQKIIDIAIQNNVTVIEDRQLARALHGDPKDRQPGVKVGGDIPQALFTAVAAIFAELESIKQKLDVGADDPVRL